jgi:hypothetical protein
LLSDRVQAVPIEGIPMQSPILHTLADQRHSDLQSEMQPRPGRRWRTRGTIVRLRTMVGGALITVGTRLSGTRPVAGGLEQRSSA